MRMHIGKKLGHFFMANQSFFLTLIFVEIEWGFFLPSEFKLSIDNGVPKTENNCFTFGHNS